MNQELLRLVDGICREKNIDRELFLQDIEQALLSAARKNYGLEADVKAAVDRLTGDLRLTLNEQPISPSVLGRIAAQTFRQVIIQKTREAERTSVFDEFIERKGTIITGLVTRVENGNMIVQIGRAEAFLPRSEQIPGETHQPGDRVRAMILDVREASNMVRIILSRTHPDMVRRLFEAEVPEVAERVIEIKALAREPGYRTKIAVSSIDSKVDAVGACVGVRGSRIKNIVEELGGEKIDIVRFNESSQILIGNALKPAEVEDIALCFELGRATVVVREDQLSLAIGKRGQNVRLAARLTNWDIDILTPVEYQKGLADLEATLKNIDAALQDAFNKIVALGMINVIDVEECGKEPLIQTLGINEEMAQTIVSKCAEAAKRIAQETEAKKTADKAAQEATAAAGEAGPPSGEAAEAASEPADLVIGENTGGESRDLALASEAGHPQPKEDDAPSSSDGSEDEDVDKLAVGQKTIAGHKTLAAQALAGALADPDPAAGDVN